MKHRSTTTITTSDGATITITRASPRVALVAGLDLLSVAGPVLAGLLTGAGLRVSDAQVIPWSELRAALVLAASGGGEQARETVISIAAAVLRSLGGIDGERLVSIAERLLVDYTTIERGGVVERRIVSAEALDEAFPDPWALAGVARAALELNLRPTSAGAGGLLQTPA